MSRRPIENFIYFLIFLLFTACSKPGENEYSSNNNNARKGRIEFKLTDDPYHFKYFRIDIEKLEYHTSNDPTISTGWKEIPLINKGIIDIIQFSNGKEFPLGSIEMELDTIKLLRIKFGTRNTFGINTFPYGGNTSFFDMALHPSITNGLVIPVDITMKPDFTNRIYFDFDAFKSRLQTGSTNFQLLPSVRVFDANNSSAIEGKVIPMEAKIFVRVIYLNHTSPMDYTDTAYGYPDVSGYFKILGLHAAKAIPDTILGIQKVEFIPRSIPQPPYIHQEKKVTLIPGSIIQTGTITISQ